MTTREEETVALLRHLFEEISRGNVAPFLERCSEDVELYVGGPPEVPFAGRRRGRAAVTQYLRDAVSDVVETTEMMPHEFIVSGENAVVLGHALCRVRSNGVPYRNEWAIVLTLRDGMFTRIAEYFNSAVIVYALRGEDKGDLTVPV